MGEPLNEKSKDKHRYQGQNVHVGSGARPAIEENFSILTPEEGHVRQHIVSGLHRRHHSYSVGVVHGWTHAIIAMIRPFIMSCRVSAYLRKGQWLIALGGRQRKVRLTLIQLQRLQENQGVGLKGL
ncbi:hypothetical protein GH714_027510 [Hevea brasiliensis]|uniref:Uncharacterized protein n=1 Tax=Hevea brasiliensis TaxID=3981 RepID=A0A6A6MHU9_HEVBR|nr:hypothetical protein GH714_027510 [Hevea brasiliensis]